MTVHVIPIEPLDQRYTAQWIDWFHFEFVAQGVDAVWYQPESKPRIERGQFLDVINTNKFKADQLSMLCEAFDTNDVKDGDVVFFFDLWFPGLEMLFYIRDGLGINFKIAGVLHAGTWDPFDFLTQKGMRTWAVPMEKAWIAECDLIFLATQFHRELLKSRIVVGGNNLCVSGLPLYHPVIEELTAKPKEKIIVFPHRIAPEKQPELFDDMAEALRAELPDWQFIKTQETPRSKGEYYDLLQRASVAVSFAQQETWGIAMLEALFYKCLTIAPNRLAYPETLPESCLYRTIDEAFGLVIDAACDYDQMWTPATSEWRRNMIKYHAGAIPRMIQEMRGKGWAV